MTVSIIIVNYNVKFFLEQCLHSVRRAAQNMAVEVIVLDNQSTDGSLEYLRPRFPEVKFILNEENLGFGKACNKGLQYATGEYILYLNPDTLLSEDTLEKCVRFFETHSDAGALGVRMIDGAGKFLKESKRSFPSPQTSLFKLFGLSRLFPHSKLFSRYHLGHLDPHQNHEVDVLAGAFMLIKKEVLDKVGAFDEAFFMYGEDVDLSYRIQKGGYKNYYLAETEIIHFKGESTKKGSLNYVRMFYSAMSTFVQKHYGGSRAAVFHLSIQAAIWLRAALSAVGRFVRWVGLPVIDAAFILLSFLAVKKLWTSFVRPDYHYPDVLLKIALPAFTLIFLVVAYYAGLYDRQYKKGQIVRSTFIATIILLAVYALLPEQYRFSRGIVVFGAVLSFFCISLLRKLLVKNKYLYTPGNTQRPDVLVAGSSNEFEAVKTFLQKKGLHTKLIGYLGAGKEQENAIAPVSEVDKIAAALNAQELILCAGTLSYKKIISLIQAVQQPLRLRFYAMGSCSIVGSDSTNATGEAISSEKHFNIEQPSKRRAKRLIDILFSLLFLVTFPVQILLVKRAAQHFKNAFAVLLGLKTWIGYCAPKKQLPLLRKGIITADGNAANRGCNEKSDLIDFWYAQNYEPGQDVKLILKNYRSLGV